MNQATVRRQHHPRKTTPHPAWLVASLVASAAVGVVFFLGYWFFATFELLECVNLISDAPSPPSHREGGQDASVYVAAFVSGAVWLGAWWITSTTRLRRWPLLLVLIFALADIAALVVLWYLAPAIWGPEHCVPD